MEKNKTGKYLKYAIGEIILVVIGILIALQINNWNEALKERQIEVKYLTSLKLDLATDLINLDSIINIRKRKVSSAAKLLALDSPKTVVKLKTFNLLKAKVLGWNSFTPRTNTLDELISSGSLNKIKNNSVKFYLLSNREIIETITIYNEHMSREYNEFLYGPQSRLTDLNPFTDFESTIREKRFIEKDLSQKELIKFATQASDFLNNIVVRNGLKLALRNNSGLSALSAQLKKNTQKLMDIIDNDIN